MAGTPQMVKEVVVVDLPRPQMTTANQLLAGVPVYLAHGDDDQIVLPAWARATADRLHKLDIDHELRFFAGMGHSARDDELMAVCR